MARHPEAALTVPALGPRARPGDRVRPVSTLRILHVDTGRAWRGGQRQALLLARGLREAGHESLCAFRAGAPLARHAAEAGLEVARFRPRGEWDLAAGWWLRRRVRHLRPDVLHAHDNHAAALALLAGVGLAPVVASRRASFRSRRNPPSLLKLRAVDRWIAVSEAARAALLDAGVPLARVSVVHSGIPLPAVTGWSPVPPGTLRSRLGLPADCFLVLTGGWLEPVKGQRTFVEAAAHASDLAGTRWVVAGRGPDREFLGRLAEVLGVSDRVVLAGEVGDLPQRMGEVQVCVLASFREGLGTLLLDALAAGTPVVGTAGGGISEAIAEGREGLLVPAGDARSVARAVRRLYLDPALRLELGTRARDRARAFGIEATVEGTLGVYREVLARRRRARNFGSGLHV